MGSAAGRKFLAPPYCSQRAVFASPLSAFFISFLPVNASRRRAGLSASAELIVNFQQDCFSLSLQRRFAESHDGSTSVKIYFTVFNLFKY